MMSWKSVSKLLSSIRGAYNDINPATLTGAIDVIVIKQPDGSFTSGPFHVRFGKLTALAPTDKVVELYVNGQYVDFIQMRLRSAGDAYFVDSNESLCSTEHNNVATNQTSDVLLSPRWHSSIIRRRRRRARRDTANSEPDATTLDFDALEEFQPQSDCEDISPTRFNPLFSTDAVFNDNYANSENTEWLWTSLPRQLSERNPTQTPYSKNQRSTGKSSKATDGIYLEDLVSEADPSVKETYIYPPIHNSLRYSVSPNRFATDATSHCIDAGYRSDGEHSARSLSPIYPHISGLRLSLCGPTPTDEKFYENLVSYEEFIDDPDSILSNPNLTISLNGRYLSWPVAAPSIISILAYQTELPHRTVRRLETTHVRKKEARRSYWFSWGARASESSSNNETSTVRSSTADNNRLSETVQDYLLGPDAVPKHPSAHIAKEGESHHFPCNRLSSEEIARLNLKPGRNDIEFRLTTKYQGTCICSASIFVWNWNDQIVISDVDGTITRSDLLGHLLPMLGHDWTHAGVTRLYSQIAANGYRFVYLSARALGQAGITRSYLRHLLQEDTGLPDGPILLSPSSLLHALHQEVIEKKPEVFKIQCLSDVRSLFPHGRSPFYAGFGNKTNDVASYEKAGVQRCRIFTINPRGEVRNEFQPNKILSYTELSHMVDHYFPIVEKPPSTRDQVLASVNDSTPTSTLGQTPPDTNAVDMSIYSSFTYWRPSTACEDSTTPELPPP